jgi:hypothetical protein
LQKLSWISAKQKRNDKNDDAAQSASDCEASASYSTASLILDVVALTLALPQHSILPRPFFER